MLRNRHPADELADIRAEMKPLKEREAELREILMVHGADRIGSEFEAWIREDMRRRFDIDATEHFGAKALAPFFRQVSLKSVRLRRHKRPLRQSAGFVAVSPNRNGYEGCYEYDMD